MNITKHELRQKCRSIRDSFGEEFIDNASLDACNLLLESKEFEQASVLLLYYPIKNEISPLPLIKKAQKMGKKIAFPVCNTVSNTLTFHVINSVDELFPSHFGILEPPTCNEIPTLTERTVALVPALAYSKEGHRLGYGKGYYDRFLHDFPGISVGFSYSELVLDSIPHKVHDIPLKLIITENEVIYFA